MQRTRHTPKRYAVIASQKDRNLIRFKTAQRAPVHFARNLRDCSEMIHHMIAEIFFLAGFFPNRRTDVTTISDLPAEPAQLLAQPCIADCTRPHIHTSAVLSEIQWHAVNTNRVRMTQSSHTYTALLSSIRAIRRAINTNPILMRYSASSGP